VDARTRKMAGLALIAVGIVLAVVGGLADQVGIGANDDGDMGGKQLAALVVGLLLIVAGAVVATVLAKDAGDGAATTGATIGSADTSDTATPAAGTPVTEADVVEPVVEAPAEEATAEAEAEEEVAEPEPVEAADSAD
jgi:hypothetical protein